MGTSRIEWTRKVWNPIIGCSRVSEGCENCYAARRAKMLGGGDDGVIYGEYRKVKNWDGTIRVLDDRFDEPLRWRKPTRIFVCSMGDLFHENVSEKAITIILSRIAWCYQHQFIILTKRAERMCKIMTFAQNFDSIEHGIETIVLEKTMKWQPVEFPLPNLTLMVSAENQARLDERVPLLLQTPAAIRGVSLEPLLGEIDLISYIRGLNWVIVGAESNCGRPGRECKIEWIESIIQQCQQAGVPVFLKQAHIGGKLVKKPEVLEEKWLEYPDKFKNDTR